MLVKTDKALFDAINGALLYDIDPSTDYTPDTAPRVCRFNSSEYQNLMNDGKVPFVSIEYTSDDYDDNERPPIADGDRVYQYTDVNKTEVRINRHPIPVIVNYTIHVRSPKDLWQREIETEIARLLMPLYEIVLPASFLGDNNLLVDIPIRYRMEGFTRRPSFNRNERVFESRSTLKVLSWLLPGSSSILLRKTYLTAEVSTFTVDGDALDSFVVTDN